MKNYYLLLLLCFFGWSAEAQIINFPDPAFKQFLLDYGGYDINNQYLDIDANNDNQIQESEALAVYGLVIWYQFEVTSISGIEYFSNLTNIDIKGMSFTNLDLSVFPNMASILISESTISTLAFNGTNLANLSVTDTTLTALDLSDLAGNSNLITVDLSYNQLTSIDLSPLQSCPNLATLKLNDNHLTGLDWSPIAANANITEINLRNNEIAAFDFSQINSAVDRIYMSGNQLTSVDFTALNHNLQALRIQDNPYPYFDTAGLSHIDTLVAGSETLLAAKFTSYDFFYTSLHGQNIQSIDFKNGINESCFTVSHTCQFFGLIGPYFHTFRNPNQIICVDDFPNFTPEEPPLTDRSERNYWSLIINGEDLEAQDPLTGPNITAFCSEEPGGFYNTISGNVKYDCGGANLNLFQIPVRITESGYVASTQTNLSGDYHLYSPEANVTVAPEIANPAFFTVTPANYSFAFDSMGNTETANFCITPNGTHHDVEVSAYPITTARPGFNATYVIVYKNSGNQVASGNVTASFDDSIMDFIIATPTQSSVATNTLQWDFTNLAPLESRFINFTVNLSASLVNINDELNYSAQVVIDQADEVPANNHANVTQTVIGSFDPNDKQVSEGAQVNIDDADKYLHYTVRFQNSGTAAAENVVIEDFLEDDLNPNTVIVESASHPYRAVLSRNNQLKIFFSDINLPAAIDNEPASHGYVSFKVKPKSNVTVGTEINNTASIYFDFNFPIVTNETSTTFTLLGTQDFSTQSSIVVYPNPAQNELHIRNNNPEDIQSVKIYNLLGQLMFSKTDAQRELSIDISRLNTGNYFVRIATESAVSTQHFIKK